MTVYRGPFISALVIVIIVRVKPGRVVRDEERPLLAEAEESPPQATSLIVGEYGGASKSIGNHGCT